MTWQDLGGLGDFVSGVGVVLTLAYALFEYRRRRREIEMQAAYDGELHWSEFNMQTATDPQLALLAERSFAPDAKPEHFTASELAQLNFIGRAFLHRLEAQWFVSQRRGLPREIWAKRRAWARAYIDSPMGRLTWERERSSGNLTTPFIREIESAEPCAVLPAATPGQDAQDRASGRSQRPAADVPVRGQGRGSA